ncbi:MAG: sigma 54-interacting transcriptional regulator [bacterium]
MKNSDLFKTESLLEFVLTLGEQNDFSESVRLVVQKSLILFDADVALLAMLNPRTHETIKTLFKENRDVGDRQYHVIHTSVSGWVVKNNTSFLSGDIKSESRLNRSLFTSTTIKSVMGMPLRTNSMVSGTLILLRKAGSRAFTENDLALAEKLAALVSPYLRDVQNLQAYFTAPLPDQTLTKKYHAYGLIGKSKKYIELLKAVEAAARCDVRILLEGQTGTGKELLARAIHNLSARAPHEFVTIDCGAIPANLLESELFGHVKGAFTGADRDRKGLLEEAHRGTLFMDEIANLPLEMQIKLMRFLQEGEFRPVGSNKTRDVDVRVIAASSASLLKMVEAQEFRQDLYYRLNVYPVQVPSLQERRQDIPLLANHFLEKFVTKQSKNARSFRGEILEFMKSRAWPGNIRELENFVERLVTVAPESVELILPEFLPPDLQKEFEKRARSDTPYWVEKSLAESLAEFEEQILRHVLAKQNWNQSQTARLLKISEHTLRYKMKKLNIIRPS